MEEFTTIINQLGSPYTDIIWVSVLFIVTAVFSYLLAVITEKKQEAGQIVDTTVVEEGAESVPSGQAVEDTTAAPRQEERQEDPDTGAREEEPGSSNVFRSAREPERGEEPQESPDVFKAPAQESSAVPETDETVTDEVAETPPPPEPVKEEEQPREDLFTRLRKGLSRTHAGIFGKLENVFSRNQIDTELWDEFEESLITADLGVSTTMKLRENLESEYSGKNLEDASGIMDALKEQIRHILKKVEAEPISLDRKPTIIMVAGANGVGKTTTIGKLANRFTKEGKKVMIAAGDTFRAAAVEQLEIWANRVGASFIKAAKGADPSSVAFDAVQSSVSKGTDVLIIDTAGRLHTKSNLMDELSKIKRVVGNKVEGAPHEILLVLDATTGQNSIQQAKTFKEAIDVSGIVLTKLDGTSRGGVIVAIADELNIPVKFIGIGEALDDLREFNADEFVEALFLSGEETVH